MANDRLVVVTGGAGYLGSVMIPLLLEAGYRVRVIDRFFFGKESLAACADRIEMIEADTRWCNEKHFAGAYAVLDLAALSNDPAGELDAERTYDINFRARERTATLAKKQGAKRYVLASSCSVYGFQEDTVDETSATGPITVYAESSLKAEQATLALQDDSFCVTAFRQGTLYGLSPRMRFDLVVNAMSLSLCKDKIITVRGGDQWRPLLHVADSAAAFVAVLDAPVAAVGGEVFNLGGTEHNYTVNQVADQVRSVGGEGDIVYDKTAVDTRSYRVSFEKVKSVLSITPKRTPADGAREVLEALNSGVTAQTDKTQTVQWYKTLLHENPSVLDAPFADAA